MAQYWRACPGKSDGYPHLASDAAKVITSDGYPRVACQYCRWQRRLPHAWHDTMIMLQVWEAAHPPVEPVVCPLCGKEATYLQDSDRYVHDDGSDNRRCWRLLSVGRAGG
jgi:hypothetical protein